MTARASPGGLGRPKSDGPTAGRGRPRSVQAGRLASGPGAGFTTELGTPAMTTRGFEEFEAETVANLIADVLDNPRDEANIAQVAEQVKALCRKFPVYSRA